ncbi:MAG: hypothetical protein HKN43_09080 [Rhodothermales bacterium]|nr:hypothetical protein [Rhodothermales bacterium]
MPILKAIVFVSMISLLCGDASAKIQGPHSGDDLEMLLPSESLRAAFVSAREAYLSFKLDDAEHQLYHLSTSEGGEAAAYLYLSSISMYRFLMTDRDEYEEEFLLRSDSLKTLLDDIDDSPWRIFIGAEANLQRAVVRVKRGRYIRAALAARTAYKEYNRVISDDPHFYDAYKGLGLLHLTFEYAPGFYKRFLNILGYSSMPGQGVAELTKASEASLYNWEESRVMLGVLDVVLFGSQRNGEAMLRSLYNQYPENPIFSHVLGFYLYSNRRVDEAIVLFRESADRYDDPTYFFIDYTDQFLATCYFYRGDFEESIFYNKRYINNHPGPAVKAPANLNVGLALELLGRRGEAIPYYENVVSRREFDLDDVAEKKARSLIEAPMSAVERTMLLAQNALAAGKYEHAALLLTEFMNSGHREPNEIAEATYVLARVNHAAGNRARAFDLYQQVIDVPRDPDTRWAPWAEYYRGFMFEEDGRIELARHSYSEALRYEGDYEYKRSVEDLATLALKRLELPPVPGTAE